MGWLEGLEDCGQQITLKLNDGVVDALLVDEIHIVKLSADVELLGDLLVAVKDRCRYVLSLGDHPEQASHWHHGSDVIPVLPACLRLPPPAAEDLGHPSVAAPVYKPLLPSPELHAFAIGLNPAHEGSPDDILTRLPAQVIPQHDQLVRIEGKTVEDSQGLHFQIVAPEFLGQRSGWVGNSLLWSRGMRFARATRVLGIKASACRHERSALRARLPVLVQLFIHIFPAAILARDTLGGALRGALLPSVQRPRAALLPPSGVVPRPSGTSHPSEEVFAHFEAVDIVCRDGGPLRALVLVELL